jgi:hypothetical protein
VLLINTRPRCRLPGCARGHHPLATAMANRYP